EDAPALLAHLPARGDALAVELAHAHRGLAERGAVGRVDGVDGAVPLLAGHLEPLHLGAVEAADAGQELPVAARAPAVDDLRHRLLDVRGRGVPAPAQLLEGGGEAGLVGPQHGDHAPLGADLARHGSALPADLGPEAAELLLDALVAAID